MQSISCNFLYFFEPFIILQKKKFVLNVYKQFSSNVFLIPVSDLPKNIIASQWKTSDFSQIAFPSDAEVAVHMAVTTIKPETSKQKYEFIPITYDIL